MFYYKNFLFWILLKNCMTTMSEVGIIFNCTYEEKPRKSCIYKLINLPHNKLLP